MSFVSNGGKFKLYTVLNGLIFPTPTQPRISFEHAIYLEIMFNFIPHSSEKFLQLARIKCPKKFQDEFIQ
jgi:hypothetical protein